MGLISIEGVRIRDCQQFFRIIQEFLSSPKKLAVVTDYDGALTRIFPMDEGHCTSFDIVSRALNIPQININEVRSGIDQMASIGAINPASWDDAFESFRRYGLRESTIENLFLQDSSFRICPRDSFKEMLSLTEEYQIPVYIVSGGIGDVIRSHIDSVIGYIPGNIRIVSTYLLFSQGQFLGPSKPVVTSISKEQAMFELGIMDEIAVNKLIVIGDYIHDAMPSLTANPILRIGISEGNHTHKPEALLDHFDVITHKDSLGYVMEVIRALSKNI